jgi:hypothetical protein
MNQRRYSGVGRHLEVGVEVDEEFARIEVTASTETQLLTTILSTSLWALGVNIRLNIGLIQLQSQACMRTGPGRLSRYIFRWTSQSFCMAV